MGQGLPAKPHMHKVDGKGGNEDLTLSQGLRNDQKRTGAMRAHVNAHVNGVRRMVDTREGAAGSQERRGRRRESTGARTQDGPGRPLLDAEGHA